tara:strand:- start:18346 stop:18870 length:525 start_codon:yes stop_codon:yes gene_type:complete
MTDRTKISELQAKKAVRKANPERQWGNSHGQSLTKFRAKAGELVDLFALYIEQRMPLPPNSGRGCRVQLPHVEMAFGRMYQAMRQFMDDELTMKKLKENEEKDIITTDINTLHKERTLLFNEIAGQEKERLRLLENIRKLELSMKDVKNIDNDRQSLYYDMLKRLNELEGEEEE